MSDKAIKSPAMNAASQPEAIPQGIYYSKLLDNFYDMASECGKGADFHGKWYERRAEFPDESSGSGAVTPVAMNAASQPDPAVCEGCNGHGMVGNILDTDTCPFCDGSGEVTVLEGSGPDTYEMPANCLPCGGTGAVDQGSATSGEAALEQALEAEYPIPDSPHTSVLQHAAHNRIAFGRGYRAALAAKAEPLEIQLQARLKGDGWVEVNQRQFDTYTQAGTPVRKLYCYAAPVADQANTPVPRVGGNTCPDLFKLAQLVVATYDDEHLSAVSLDRAMRNLRDYFATPVAERAAAPASVPEGYVLARETVVEMPDGTKELGYTLLSGVGVFQAREEVSATIAELSLPLGWVSMTTCQLLPGWMLPAAPEVAQLAAQGERAAPSESRGNAVHQILSWLRAQANAEQDPGKRAAFIEAHNAALSLATPAPTAGESSARPDGACNSALRAAPADQHGIYSNGCGQHSPKLAECATCNLEIWPPNSLRGYGNYKQYCQCVKVQVRKVTAQADINAPSRGRAQGGMHENKGSESKDFCATQGRKEGKA